MKKQILSGILVLFVAGGLMAQNNKRTTAYNYMRDGDLAKALEYIEPTIEHDRTKDNEKTWRYRGQIYSLIAGSENEEYKNLHPNPVQEAARSFQKAMELDARGTYERENLQALSVVQQQANFYAGQHFNENQFNKSYENFKLAAELAQDLGAIDTVAIYNAGLAAERGEMYPQALEQYQQSIALGYLDGRMYVFTAMLHETMGNDNEYIALVREGRSRYPTDTDLIRLELNYYLQNDQFEEAENNLKLAIAEDPNDKALQFALGVVYDNLGRVEDAAAAYSKAVEVDADYFDALYNLGALYYNRAVELNQEANDSPDDKVYQQKRAEAAEYFNLAEPFLDRARVIEPDDMNTLNSLRQLYAFTNQTEKYTEIRQEIESKQ